MKYVKFVTRHAPGCLIMIGLFLCDYCLFPCNAVIWGITMIVLPVLACKEGINLDALRDDAILDITRERRNTIEGELFFFGCSFVLYFEYSVIRMLKLVAISFSISSVCIYMIAGMYTYEIYRRFVRKWTSDYILRIICCVLIACMTCIGIIYIDWGISPPSHREANVIEIGEVSAVIGGYDSQITVMLDNGKKEVFRSTFEMGKKASAGTPLVRCEHHCLFGITIRDLHYEKGADCGCSDCNPDD